ncbi:TonB-dependent receptor [Sphingomonas sp. KC8]|uniref:TonB-dependent receptor n=1 Tax=Sphingomonas sp. KC8 TaxID=1030157 RepID=UPI0002489C6A|nr:TonB-dependent receptor [Sphingomonas sp. KC8]
MVTALRRESTVQDTPLAITAISGQNLTNAGVTNVTDYAKMVPGLRVQDSGPGQRRLSLRGIRASGEPTVGTYYDETPVAGSVGVSSDAAGRTPDFSLFDIERVEVLRGPQGTLYGSSSMGGAVRVIFAKPKFEYEGAAEATVSTTKGGGFSYNINGMVNVPIANDVLAARLVVYRRDSSGYVDNSFLGRDDVNDYTAEGGRFLLRYTPTADLTIDASALIESTNASSYSWNPLVGERKSAAQAILPYKDDSQIYNITARWDAGPVALTAITSYQHRKSEYAADDSYYIDSYLTPARCAAFVNGGGACSQAQLDTYYAYVDSLSPAVIHYPGKTKDWTHELRLNSTGDGNLSWTVGVFSENRSNQVNGQDARVDPATGEIIRPLQLFYRRSIDDKFKQIAGYGEASYKVTPELTLTGGTRYFHYKKTIVGETDMPWDLIGATAKPPTTVQSKESGWIFKFNADYQFSPDFMIYAQASQGFRPGGANQVIGLADALTAYEADKLWNYELGAKTAFFNRRLFANVAVFQIDWENMQVSGRTLNNAFSFISNAGAARVRGAELELNARPIDGMQVNLNSTYLDAKLTEDQISDTVSAPGRKGNRMPYIPRFTAGATVEYGWEVSPSLKMVTRADINHVGASYSEFRPDNALRIKLKPYQLANMRVGLEEADGRWAAYVFLNNVFDAVAINHASQSSTPNSYSVTSATPRTIGVNLRTKF